MLVAVSVAEEIRDKFRNFVISFSTIQHSIYFLKFNFQFFEKRQ